MSKMYSCLYNEFRQDIFQVLATVCVDLSFIYLVIQRYLGIMML